MRLLSCTIVWLSLLGVTSVEAGTLKAVASFTIIADFVRQVGGDKVVVKALVGPNGDPHTYEPTPNDARTLKDADIVFVNGLGLEGWIDRLIAASGYKGRAVVVSTGIAPLKIDENGKTVADPHAWNAAGNAIVYVRTIAAALAAADPADAAAFAENAEAYEASLARLDNDARAKIAALAPARRKILTTHDSLGYFAKAYGVEILSPLGFSTEQEPSAAGLAALIREIRSAGVRSYFLENSNDPRLIEQIARATGAKPGGELFVESLSRPGQGEADYIAMFRHNLDLIVEAMRRNS